MLTLPPELEAAISQTLRTLPASQWQSAARNLSQRYRTADEDRRHQTTASTNSASKSRTQHSALSTQYSLGYLGFILPAAYAQLHGALQATVLRAPSFQPTTMLDIGSGPGTALWAAAEHFPTLTSIHAYERETAFITLAKTLAQSSPNPAVRNAHWRQINITGSLPTPDLPLIQNTQYDLVVIGHALNEMSPQVRDALVQSAWQQCSGLLLIVEPGTSSAFPMILRA
ncbi:MAG: small ribosomal subunit Rsm22 family protein, partial [Chloroflexia bacterium]